MNIAVVIPALDEADEIERAVSSAAGPGVDVIVVDGGSCDGTRETALGAGARVMNAQGGRARQLQVGIEASESDVVLAASGSSDHLVSYDDMATAMARRVA